MANGSPRPCGSMRTSEERAERPSSRLVTQLAEDASSDIQTNGPGCGTGPTQHRGPRASSTSLLIRRMIQWCVGMRFLERRNAVVTLRGHLSDCREQLARPE